MRGRQVRRVSETPCWWIILLLASTFASIDTIAAWSNGRPWRWAYCCVLCIAQCTGHATRSPRHLYVCPSFFYLRLTCGGIGAGEFEIGEGSGGGVSAGAGAGAVATDAGDEAMISTDCGMGT